VQAALRSSAALVSGVAMAWLVAVVATADILLPGTAASTAVAAGAASFLIVIASRIVMLSIVPATFYGFASTFAYLSLSSGAFTLEALTSFGWRNPLFSVSASLLSGTGLGMMHGWLTQVLATRGTSSPHVGFSATVSATRRVKQ
jgi:hypothetical protein